MARSGQAACCISACTCLELMQCTVCCTQIYSQGKRDNHLLPSFFSPPQYVKLLSVPSEVDWTTQNQGKYAKGNGEQSPKSTTLGLIFFWVLHL